MMKSFQFCFVWITVACCGCFDSIANDVNHIEGETIRGIRIAQGTVSEKSLRLNFHAFIVGVPNQTDLIPEDSLFETVHRLDRVLTQKYGFQTELLIGREATVLNIDETLRSYVESLTDNDFLLIVFAGNTAVDTFLDESYWIAAPGDEGIPYSANGEFWFSCNRVLKYISAMEARHVLILNNGHFAWNKKRGLRIVNQEHENEWYFRIMEQPSRMILNRPPRDEDVSIAFLQEMTSLLESNEHEFLACSELSSLYRDLTGDSGYEFGRLHDYKGSTSGEFVFANANADWELLDDPLVPKLVPNHSDTLDHHASASPQLSIPDVSPEYYQFRPSRGDSIPQQLAFDQPFDSNLNSRDYLDDSFDNFGCVITSDAVVGKALNFENRSFFCIRDEQFKDLALGDFTFAFWAKNKSEHWMTLMGIGSSDRGVGVSMRDDYHLSFSAHGPQRLAYWQGVVSKEPISLDKWYHVVAVKEGNKLKLYVNRELQGTFEADYVTFGNNSHELFIGRQSNAEGDSNDFTGSIDELQIYTRAIDPEEINALYRKKFDRFGVSPTVAIDSSDMDRIARMSFGPDAKMADWRDIVNLYEGECDEFMDAIGLEQWEGAFVRCDGERIWKENRHFLVTRHSGTPRDYYLVHEDLDDHQLDLGSWFMTSLKVLIQKY